MHSILNKQILFYSLVFLSLYLFPNSSNAQVIMESKGENTPIRVFGAETMKVYGGFKHNQEVGANGDLKKAQLNFTNPNSQFFLTDTLFNATGIPLFIKTNSGADSSHVIFQSINNSEQYIIGDSINFYKISLNQNAADHQLVLTADITLRDTLKMQLGKLNLNNHNLTLLPEETDAFTLSDPQPYILGEDSLSYIWDTLNGVIYLDICVPINEINNTPYNFGGLGAELQVPANTINGDIISFSRSYGTYPIDTLQSIYRRYNISGVDEIPGGVNFNFNYQSHDLLDEHNEEFPNLVLFRSKDNGVSWKNFYRDTSFHDLYNRVVEKEAIDSLAGIWTLGPCADPPVLALPDSGAINICAYDTLWLDVGLNNVSIMWSDSSSQSLYPYVADNPPFGEPTSFDKISVVVTDSRGCATYWENDIVIHHSPIHDLIAQDSVEYCEDVDIAGVNTEIDPFFDYTYEWHDGSTEYRFEFPLTPTGDSLYWVTATYSDILTCASTDTVNVIIYPRPMVMLPDTVAYTCDGSSIVLNVTDYPGAEYRWFNDSGQINGANTNTYEVPAFIGIDLFRVEVDYNGICFDFAEQTIVMSNLELNTESTNVLCNGDDSGSININLTGFYDGYLTYFNGIETNDSEFTNLAPDTYIVEANDEFCSTSDTILITEPEAIIGALSITDIDCFTPGQIDFAPSGGVMPYSFLWSNGETTEDLSNLTLGGPYSVTLTDANECTFVLTDTVMATDVLTTFIEGLEIACFGEENGELTIFVSTGTPPYNYSWNNGENTPTISNLSAGFYSVTVTDGLNCTSVQEYNLQNPPPLIADYLVQNIQCAGESNGMLTAQNIGGSPPLFYEWSTGASTANLSNLGVGNYFVTISDANECIVVDSFTITEPSLLSVTLSSTDIDCNNSGQLDLSPTGGTLPYSFEWSNGASTEDQTVDIPGVYSVTITDTNSCSQITSAEIFSTANLNLSLFAQDDILCNGGDNGAVSLSVSGGAAPFVFDIGFGPTTDSLFTGLSAGMYTAIVVDANNCMDTLEVVLNDPPLINIDVNTTDADCGQNNGTVNVVATGGIGGINFYWPDLDNSNASIDTLSAGIYNLIITDGNDCSIPVSVIIGTQGGPDIAANPTIEEISCYGLNDGAITVSASGGTGPLAYSWSNMDSGNSIDNLEPGVYNLTVSDTNNCQDFASFTLEEPDSLVLNLVPQNIVCNNELGSISAFVSGGTMDYQYDWSNGTDSMTAIDLTSGSYSLTVTDANGCSLNDMTEVLIDNTNFISVTSTITPIDCNGELTGAASLNVITNSSFSVNWNTGQIGTSINNLAAGTYTATITNNICTEIVEAIVSQPDAIEIMSNLSNVSCGSTDDGAIDLTVTGGNPDYNYLWSSGQVTEDISNLTAGNYEVTITDMNNCNAITDFDIGSSNAFSVNATGTDLTCFEINDGTATANTFGGLAPFNYSWNNGGNAETIENLPIGTYSVTVTDAANCIDSSEVILTQPIAIDFNFTFDALNCFGDTDGAITIASTGGPQSNHQYNWSTGQVGPTISNLPGGDYIVTITSGSCMQPEEVTLEEPDQIIIEYTSIDVACFGESNGSISTNVIGGIGALSYNWDNGESSSNISNLAAGFYSLTVTDSNTCTGEQLTMVDEPDLIVITDEQQLSGCQTAGDGWIDITIEGGVTDYSFNWSNGATTEDINNLDAGIYTITVTDQNNCVMISEIELAGSPEPFEALFLAATPVNFGDTIQFVDVSYPVPNEWNWSFGDLDFSVSNIANPEFFYPEDSTAETSFYDVTLIAATEFCRDTIVKTITIYNFRSDAPEPDTNFIVGQFFEYFKVYPNPTDGRIVLDTKLKQEGSIDLHLSDTHGRLIRKYKLEGNDTYFQTFDLGQLPGGMYLLTGYHKNDKRTVKLIVIDERQ